MKLSFKSGVSVMPDYKKRYFALAARVADAIELLTKAQQEGEDSYIEVDDNAPETTTACDPT